MNPSPLRKPTLSDNGRHFPALLPHIDPWIVEEMKKLERLTLRLDSDTLRALMAEAEKRDLKKSTYAARLIKRALKSACKKKPEE